MRGEDFPATTAAKKRKRHRLPITKETTPIVMLLCWTPTPFVHHTRSRASNARGTGNK